MAMKKIIISPVVVMNLYVNISDKEPADMRVEKTDGNKHGKNEMAFP